MKSVDIEALRQMFADQRVHVAMAIVDKTEILLDYSKAKAQCRVFPEENEIVAEVSWGSAGPDAGDFQMPQPGDLVLVAYADSGEAFVIQRLSSKVDTIPKWGVKDGHRVIQALAGKQLFLGGPDGVFLGAGGTGWAAMPPDEPVPLGNVLASCLNDVFAKLDAILDKIISGPVAMSASPGSPAPTYPQLAADLGTIKGELTALKAQYLDTAETSILSETVFTER